VVAAEGAQEVFGEGDLVGVEWHGRVTWLTGLTGQECPGYAAATWGANLGPRVRWTMSAVMSAVRRWTSRLGPSFRRLRV
jgi:hypothetical protein